MYKRLVRFVLWLSVREYMRVCGIVGAGLDGGRMVTIDVFRTPFVFFFSPKDV